MCEVLGMRREISVLNKVVCSEGLGCTAFPILLVCAPRAICACGHERVRSWSGVVKYLDKCALEHVSVA